MVIKIHNEGHLKVMAQVCLHIFLLILIQIALSNPLHASTENPSTISNNSSKSIFTGLKFYHNFEGSITPNFATGSTSNIDKGIQHSYKFLSGRHGLGLYVNIKKNFPSPGFITAGNFPATGTLSFWVKPDPDQSSGFNFLIHAQPTLLYNDSKITIWSHKGIEHHYGPSATAHADSNGWIHITYQWDKITGKKILYINGKQSGECSAPPIGSTLSFFIGSKDGTSYGIAAVFDDLFIWDRLLSDKEIGIIYDDRLDNQMTDTLNVLTTNLKPETKEITIGLASKNIADGLYLPGQQIVITTPIENLQTGTYDSIFVYSLINYYGITVQEKSNRIRFDEKTLSDTITFSHQETGIYRIRLTCKIDKQIIASQDVATLSIIPRELSERKVSNDDFYGCHTLNDDFHLGLISKLGIKIVRLHDLMQYSWWWRSEPEKGKINYHDQAFDRIKKYDIKVIGCLTHAPPWATNDPDNENPRGKIPVNLKDWDSFVESYVRHHKDFIKIWEVWNEPNHIGFWQGTPKQYADLLIRTSRIIKSIDKNLIVIGGGGIGFTSLQFLEDILKENVIDSMDYLSFHWYLNADETNNILEIGDSGIDSIKRILRKYGEEKPLFNSEGGITSTTFYKDLQLEELPPLNERTPTQEQYKSATNATIKAIALQRAAGVKHWSIYYIRGDNVMHNSTETRARAYVDYGFLDWGDKPYAHTPKAQLIAYAFNAYLFGNSRFYKKQDIDETIFCYTFYNELNNTTSAIIFAKTKPGNKLILNLKLPKGKVTVKNIMLNPIPTPQQDSLQLTLSEEPIYLIAEDMTPERLTSAFEMVVLPPTNFNVSAK